MYFTTLDILLITQRDLLTNPLPYLSTPFYFPRLAFMAYGPRFVARFNGRAFDYWLFTFVCLPPPAFYLTYITVMQLISAGMQAKRVPTVILLRNESAHYRLVKSNEVSI